MMQLCLKALSCVPDQAGGPQRALLHTLARPLPASPRAGKHPTTPGGHLHSPATFQEPPLEEPPLLGDGLPPSPPQGIPEEAPTRAPLMRHAGGRGEGDATSGHGGGGSAQVVSQMAASIAERVRASCEERQRVQELASQEELGAMREMLQVVESRLAARSRNASCSIANSPSGGRTGRRPWSMISGACSGLRMRCEGSWKQGRGRRWNT
jgi:hypothetical protein